MNFMLAQAACSPTFVSAGTNMRRELDLYGLNSLFLAHHVHLAPVHDNSEGNVFIAKCSRDIRQFTGERRAIPASVPAKTPKGVTVPY